MRPLIALLALVLACRHPAPVIDPPPGAAEYAPELRARLAAALSARGAGYRPHTRHLRSDGSPRWTNRLIFESSPYLLQHAHNPVDWYPWGDEAFARAARESKPVLLSIGYSTCHWCHVMEEESFENEEVAEYLNRNYIAIKVDREVRPDLDDVYMTAVQMLTGSGGWPMTVFLTPGRQPFAGGTYFPRAQFLTTLHELRAAFDAEPLQVAGKAGMLTTELQRIVNPPPGDGVPDAQVLRAAFDGFSATFDVVNGGFGRRPKFPSPSGLDFLLRYHRRTGEPHALEMVTLTLEKMAAGGIHDQIGGGFHRYATDAAWQVPHFEKMLYDNAQLAMVYLAAWQVTRRDDFSAVTRDVLDYVAREMTAPEGGFWSATDADSEGEEGKYFVWTPAELRAVLDEEHARAAATYWGITEEGNFHGTTIPHVAAPLGGLGALVDESRATLYEARRRRVPPHTDTKILTAWNALMISAFARAGAALGDAGYLERGRTAATFALDRMRPGGRLARSWADGAPHEDAFLDDHAYLAAALLDLYEATFDLRWLREAIALAEVMERDYGDAEGGGFYQTRTGGSPTLARAKPADDGALPSGNAVAALDLLRLAEFTGDERSREHADGVLRALASRLERGPAGSPALLTALESRLDRAKEIVIVRPAGARDGGAPLVATVRRTYVPNRMLTVATDGDEVARQAELIPVAAEKSALHGAATAFVCEQKVCALPTSDPAVLADQLARVQRLPDAGQGSR
ncbi:MAG TPA: thioredoxin domain-containing protein [Candidatus Binatia bacterium]|nr:thioredoxin domain-containing protein [Candidatus Binatia bacterium]